MVVERRFEIIGSEGDTFWLTEEDVYRRVMKTLTRGEEWFAPIVKIVKVCEEAGFRDRFAKQIRTAILKYFTIEAQKRLIQDNDELIALTKCYNAIGDDEEKERFLTAFFYSICRYIMPVGNDTLCKKWVNEKLREYKEKSKIQFAFIIENLIDNFKQTLRYGI